MTNKFMASLFITIFSIEDNILLYHLALLFFLKRMINNKIFFDKSKHRIISFNESFLLNNTLDKPALNKI
ncbi:hypothetical protein BpHYR1_050299 [Brachionus plicatilis]|uniref:Uncharacterized protein n=1 Tax=Brachionus plicatilis TaxID=10195 RepID=A0A3M7R3L8_BRAPC|nr:hypothetical protein BpHYR1_050299 [Brachionus plicatilis]